ncbi:PhzF family phenazine biosynthesis protein [Nonomuraea recticatena]|uniref:PhzF family phenazine biosynthesis protein n=1 Tax=Nonomuraea recticatena TaxID=46178 RepID=UPI00361BDD20
MHDVLKYVAFTSTASGGNAAGVVLDAHGLSDGQMLAIAADLGYSESAFLFPEGATPTGSATSAPWPRSPSAATPPSRPPSPSANASAPLSWTCSPRPARSRWRSPRGTASPPR